MLVSSSLLSNLSGSLSTYICKCLSALLILSFTGSLSRAEESQLTVAAAADLASAQQDLADGFSRLQPVSVRFSIGASGLLAKQIENGAPFDVFLSANEKFVKDLAAKGAVDQSTIRIYAVGRLGLWSRDGKIRSIAELTGPGVKRVAIANPQIAPYGVAAREFLERAGVWKSVEPKIVYGENVTQAFQYAESGNADAAITSWTLVSSKNGILLPPDHSPIRQACGVVAASKQKEIAEKFLKFLLSPEGLAILSRHGLVQP